MTYVKVFSIADPDTAQADIDSWLDCFDDDVEIVSISQSETCTGSDFYHLTITVVYKIIEKGE